MVSSERSKRVTASLIANSMKTTSGWSATTAEEVVEEGFVVRDANGNVLQDGDSVVLLKELKVKGAPTPLKAGTKVRSIRLVDGDHNIDCKIDGFGAMALKSEFVRKA